MDTLADQEAFARKIDIRFPLLADPDGGISRAFGAYKEEWGVPGRATWIIGEDGTVLKVYPKAPLSGEGHAREVLEDLRALV